MTRKMTMAAMVLTAIAAFALPATAAATNDPTLTENGSPVATGSKIVATNVGNLIFTNTADTMNLLLCTSTTMTGTVLTNSGGTFKGTIETFAVAGTGTGGDCTGSFGPFKTTAEPMCILSDPAMATDEFRIYADNCVNPLDTTLDITGIAPCTYKATGAIKGTIINTNSDSPELRLGAGSANSGSIRTAGSFVCPSSTALTATFNLETHDGTALTIS